MPFPSLLFWLFAGIDAILDTMFSHLSHRPFADMILRLGSFFPSYSSARCELYWRYDVHDQRSSMAISLLCKLRRNECYDECTRGINVLGVSTRPQI